MFSVVQENSFFMWLVLLVVFQVAPVVSRDLAILFLHSSGEEILKLAMIVLTLGELI